jgi:peroxiredoxin Q/BCP
MDAYRDQYAKLFGEGQNVRVLGISFDPDTALASWARDAKYPVTFLSDPGVEVGKKYGVAIKFTQTDSTGKKTDLFLDSRVVYVIDPSGKIVKVLSPFRESDPTAYTELSDAVKAVSAGHN